MSALVIAIDGPSGSGKSSTSRAVASRLNLAYLDTGSMYRAIQVAAMNQGVTDDKEFLAELVDRADLVVNTDPQNPTISVDGVDVTEAIRSPEVSKYVSNAATCIRVREVLTEQMRQIISSAEAGIVVEGRDITTKVWPQAELKLLLTADEQARVARRHAELCGQASKEEVVDQVVRRDRDDSTMSKFMTASEGVTTINSTFLTLDEVVELVCQLASEVESASS